MNKKSFILVFIIAIITFIGVSRVNATCYSYEANGQTYYATSTDSWMSNVKTVGDELCSDYVNFKNSIKSCGNGKINNIPELAPKIISAAYTLIQIAIPIVLVIMGSLDLFKGITAQKEDEIKKGQQMLVKRLIYAGLVFFVFAIVKVVISLSAESSQSYILECAECFIKNKCD